MRRGRTMAMVLATMTAMTAMAGTASAITLDGENARVVLVPAETQGVSCDPTRELEKYSTEKYSVYVYKPGERVDMVVGEGYGADVVKATDFSDFADDSADANGRITFTMPDEDLYVKQADAPAKAEEKPAECETGKFVVGELPEGISATVTKADGTEEEIAAGQSWSDDAAPAFLTARADDGSEAHAFFYKDGARLDDASEILATEVTRSGSETQVDVRDRMDLSVAGYAVRFSKSATDLSDGGETPASGVAKVDTSLNMRSEANADSSVVTMLSSGDELKILGREADGWLKVEKDGAVGYVKEGYVTVE